MKYLHFKLLVVLLLCANNMMAYDFYADRLYYNILSTSDLTVEVTYKSLDEASYSGSYIIPQTVEFDNKTYTVTAIGEEAFAGSSIYSVRIPKGIEIKEYAFSYCSQLEKVYLNTGTVIRKKAFWGCRVLQDVYTTAVEPLACDAQVFSTYKNLHTRAGYKTDYEAVSPWNNFNIIDDLYPEEEDISNIYSIICQAGFVDVGSKPGMYENFCDDIYYNDRDGDQSYNARNVGDYDFNVKSVENNVYTEAYKAILSATEVINTINNYKGYTQDRIVKDIAEARYLRAYCYWVLLRKFGPVPVIYDNADADLSSQPRSTYEECAEYIASEMAMAAKDLPLKNTSAEDMHNPTRGAALSVRALAYIYAASPLANGQLKNGQHLSDVNDNIAKLFVNLDGSPLLASDYKEEKWAKAAAACKDVMELGCYELFHAAFIPQGAGMNGYPVTVKPFEDGNFSTKNWPEGYADIDPLQSYRQIFDGDVHPFDNPEIIFTRGNRVSSNNNDLGISALVLHAMPTELGGWNCHGVTQKMVDTYYMQDGSDVDGMYSEWRDEYPSAIADGNDRLRKSNTFTRDDINVEGNRPEDHPELGCELNNKKLTNAHFMNVSQMYMNREPRFYATVAYSGTLWENGVTNNNVAANKFRQVNYYRNGGNGWVNSFQYLPTGIGMRKYCGPRDYCPNNQNTYSGIQQKYDLAIRYADILLMYAEALNELSGTYQVASWDGSATYSISRNVDEIKKGTNPVRIRAGMPDFDHHNPGIYSDRNALRKALKRERMIEFMGEGKRYYDLRRWMDAPIEEGTPIYGLNIMMTAAEKDQFYEVMPTASLVNSFSDKMYFQPIAFAELAKNKALVQSPGWPSSENEDITEDADFEVNGIMYAYTKADEVKVVGKSTDVKNLVLEGIVNYQGKQYKVTSVADKAFASNNDICAVSFGEGITSIGIHAFDGCTSLANIDFGTTVKNIGYQAFANCNALGFVYLPETVTGICANIFVNCSSLSTVLMPSINGVQQVSSILGYGYNGKVYSTEKLSDYRLVVVTYAEGAYYDGETLIYCLPHNGNVTVPNGVKAIGDYAFASGIVRTIKLPSSVETISNNAFFGTTYLNNIEVEGSNFKVEDNVLYSADESKLYCYPSEKTGSSFEVPESVKSVAGAAFFANDNLNSINFASKSVCIGEYAFFNCTGLNEMSFPNAYSLAKGVLYGCSSISTITIPSTVKIINDLVFSNCSSLTSIYSYCWPPICNNSIFENVEPANCYLYVPQALVSKYAVAEVWEKFNILGMDTPAPILEQYEVSTLCGYMSGRDDQGWSPSGSLFSEVAGFRNDGVMAFSPYNPNHLYVVYDREPNWEAAHAIQLIDLEKETVTDVLSPSMFNYERMRTIDFTVDPYAYNEDGTKMQTGEAVDEDPDSPTYGQTIPSYLGDEQWLATATPDQKKWREHLIVTVDNYNDQYTAAAVWIVDRDPSTGEFNSSSPHRLLAAYNQCNGAAVHPVNGEIYFNSYTKGEMLRLDMDKYWKTLDPNYTGSFWSPYANQNLYDPYTGEEIGNGAFQILYKIQDNGSECQIHIHPEGKYAYIVVINKDYILKADYNEQLKCFTTPYQIAGQLGQPGAIDGLAGGARLARPYQGTFVYDKNYEGSDDMYDYFFCDSGRLDSYDSFNNIVGSTIRCLNPSGVVSTIAGGNADNHADGKVWGDEDGMYDEARFHRPTGIAYNQNDDAIYILDTMNRKIRKMGKVVIDINLGIQDVENTAIHSTGIYDLNGRKINHLMRGINIVRNEDGTVRKVLVP